jgi:hypothetical protein
MNTKVLFIPIVLLTIGVYQLKNAELARDIAEASTHAFKALPAKAKPSVAPYVPEVVQKSSKPAQSVDRWRPLVAKYFPASQVDNALHVMNCESWNPYWGTGGDPSAIGDTTLTFNQAGTTYGYSVGLMQIRRLPGRPEKDWLLNPENNIRYAAGMYRAQGFRPWSCAKHIGLAR